MNEVEKLVVRLSLYIANLEQALVKLQEENEKLRKETESKE